MSTVSIVGNGIIGLQVAYRLLKDDASLRINIIGPAARPGCASLAAAAMFNSFCEVESSTLKNPIERIKFLFNKSASDMWPSLLSEIENASGTKLEYGFGTYLINNCASDRLEDENFDAALVALREFKEPHEQVAPHDIAHYKPTPSKRAGRAVYIPREGWVNPVLLIEALSKALQKTGRVNFIDGLCERLRADKAHTKIEAVEITGKDSIFSDYFVVCPGANFSEIISKSDLGISLLRIFYGAGATILLKTSENTLKNCIRTPNRGLACGVYAAPWDASHTLVGASNFISPTPVIGPRVTSVYTLLKSAMEQINSDYYRSELVRVNFGWRPTSADTLPLIGKTSIPNFIVATGTKRDGLHCSPLIAEYIADLILKGKSNHDLSTFNPERKKVTVYTRAEAIETAVRHSINAAYQHDFVPAKNRMLEQLEQQVRREISELHDKVGAVEWGIPPELIDMYRYGHVR